MKKSSRGEPLRYTLERDDGQVSASGVLADFKFECDSRLTADESLRRAQLQRQKGIAKFQKRFRKDSRF